jgi:DNA mismatch repair ATPase MutL
LGSRTAVSELIKNAYDADANLVELEFRETKTEDGTLIINDDGVE